jgi:crotonobetainyl-CoA:carnitine CoA-transferase CaiB-like acyl-CoA transferase
MAKGALNGVKVIEYCNFVAGPFCVKQFSDVGAEVIKVETVEGDESRRRGPYADDIPDPNLSELFLYNNTNKMGVTLNLETSEGRDILKKLVAGADIFVEDRAPGEMARLGLGYEVLKEVNPDLIMVSITPFGQDGPYRDYKAYYLNTFHAAGMGYLLPANSPNSDREPIKAGGYIGEYDIGACAAISVMAAYYWRRYAGGTGQYIDISKQDALIALERQNLIDFYDKGKSPTRMDRYDQIIREATVCCRDGVYVKIVLHPDRQWNGLCRALDNPEWTKLAIFGDPPLRKKNFEQLDAYLSAEVLKYDGEELFSKIQAEGTAGAPIYSAEKVFTSPQSKARDFFAEIDHPRAGKHMYPGLPYKLRISPPGGNVGAPILGQHNEEVYCGRLGYSKQDLVKLKEAGII